MPSDASKSTEKRIAELEAQLSEYREKKRPWWTNLTVSGSVIAAIVSGVISWTTLQLEDRRQQELIYQQYLKQAVEVESHPAKRELLLSFFSRVVKDDSLRAWAIYRLELLTADRIIAEDSLKAKRLENLVNTENQDSASVRRASKNLHDVRRRQAVQGLIASNRTTRWNSAETLATEFADDTKLISDLTRFVEDYTSNQLALFNVAVVLEDLKAQGKLNKLAGEKLNILFSLVKTHGGEKAKSKIVPLQ